MARVRGVDNAAEAAKQAGGGKHLQLDDGESVTLCFAGFLKGEKGEKTEPLVVEVVWLGTEDERQSEEYDPAKHNKSDKRTQFLWNVYVRDTEEMMVLTRGPRFFRKWFKAKKKNLMGHWFEMERIGVKIKSRYPLKKEEEIEADEMEDILGLDLHDLDEAAFGSVDDDDTTESSKRRTAAASAGRAQRSAPTGNNSGAGNGSINTSVAEAMRQLIRDLPDPENVFERFKKKFSVDKLKDLPASRQREAETWIGAAGKLGSAVTEEPQTKAEVEPFE